MFVDPSLSSAQAVAPAPSCDATPRIGAAPLDVRFDGSGSKALVGSIASWSWDFGDGEHGTGVAPLHRYEQPGRYQAALEVTDDQGHTSLTAVKCEITVTASQS